MRYYNLIHKYVINKTILLLLVRYIKFNNNHYIYIYKLLCQIL